MQIMFIYTCICLSFGGEERRSWDERSFEGIMMRWKRQHNNELSAMGEYG